jgi:signal peptidase
MDFCWRDFPSYLGIAFREIPAVAGNLDYFRHIQNSNFTRGHHRLLLAGGNAMRKVVNWIGNILLVLVISTMFFFFLAPHFLGVSFFTVYGGSMVPTIPIGSIVAAKSVEASAINVGDIITFRTGAEVDRVVTHRVVEVSNGSETLSFRTAGDNNANPDGSAVLAENVIGKVWFYVPLLGYLSSFVTTKLGFILLIIVPGIFIIALEVRNIIVELRLMRKETCTGNR